MLKESETSRYSTRSTHRTYAPEFKAALVAACQKPGASIAGLARQHGMNAGVLRRWLKESAGTGSHQGKAVRFLATPTSQATPTAPTTPTAQLGVMPTPAFIPLRLVPAAEPPSSPALEVGVIKVELRKGTLAMTISWPITAAADFAHWSVAVLQ